MEQNFLVGRFTIKEFDRMQPLYVLVMPVLEYDESIVDTDFADVREGDFHVITCRTRITGSQGPIECDGAPSEFDEGRFELTSPIPRSYLTEFGLKDDTLPREVTSRWVSDISDYWLCMLVIVIVITIEVIHSVNLEIKVDNDR